MPTTTANLGLTLPTPNVDTGWGSTLNTDFTLIDNLFTAAGTGTSVGINVGTGKTLGIGGTLLLGSGDGTGTTAAPTIRGAARTGTNVVGSTLVIDAPNGTGTGGSGAFVFRTAAPGASGTTANTMQNSVVIYNSGTVGISGGLETGGFINAAEYSIVAGSGGRVNFNATTVAGASTPIAFAKGLLTNGSASFSGDLGLYTASGGAYNERLRIGSLGQVGVNGANYGSAGQVLTSNGSGSSVSWNTPVTTSNVLSATAGASAGAVGTYGFLAKAVPAAGNPGDLVAGSALRWTNANGGLGTAPAGTWMLMGLAGTGVSGSPTLWLRVA